MRKKKDFGLDPNIRIISGDSEEANKIYKELGWYEEKPQAEDANYMHVKRMNKVLRYLFAFLLAWLSNIFANEDLWLFLVMFFTWHAFIKDEVKGV